MPGVKRILAASAMALCLATPVAAEGDLAPDASEALQGLVRLLEGIIKSVPQYELPEVLDNGDIIIRRVPEEGEDPHEEEETEPIEDI